MKRNIMILALCTSLALCGAIFAAGQHGGRGGRGHGGGGWHGDPMGHLTQALDLTAEQQAKVQPIVDQAKPQIRAIREEAMQKSKAVMENTATQLRPILTPEQQAKFDRIRKAHQDLRAARMALRDARKGQ